MCKIAANISGASQASLTLGWKPGIRISVLFLVLFLLGCASQSSALSVATPQAPQLISDAALIWQSPPGVPGLQAAWVIGAEKEKGLYIIRVKLQAGTTIPPHHHPDDRLTTVLRGSLLVGFGKRLEESQLVKVTEGMAYRVPAHVPHYIVARQKDVVYQETGVGPTATVFAN